MFKVLCNRERLQTWLYELRLLSFVGNTCARDRAEHESRARVVSIEPHGLNSLERSRVYAVAESIGAIEEILLPFETRNAVKRRCESVFSVLA